MNKLVKEFKDYNKFLDELIIKTNSKRKEYSLILLRKDVNRLIYALERNKIT